MILACRHFRWIGHVSCMSAAHVSQQTLYGHLQSGQRSTSSQKKRLKDHIKELLKKCNIPPSDLERTAAERTIWWSSCLSGISHLEEQTSLRRAEKRSQCHACTSLTIQPNQTHTCPTCGKICGLQIDYISTCSGMSTTSAEFPRYPQEL